MFLIYLIGHIGPLFRIGFILMFSIIWDNFLCWANKQLSLRDGNYLIFKDAPKIETIKAGLKYIDINVLRRFSAILHCNGISSHFNIRRSLSSDSYINKSTAKHFTNLGRETFVYLLSPNLSISQGTWKHFKIKS